LSNRRLNMKMRSKKRVKSLKEIIRPYTITPNCDISGNINAVPFFFPVGIESEISLEEYQTLLNSVYRDQL